MQTDATSHNIVSPTMLGVVGICCVVHANERNSYQHCWRSSKEAMHSGTVILTMRVHRRFHEANIVVIPCKCSQHCCATLRRSRNNKNVGTCCAKSLTGFKPYATSANKCQQVPPTLLWFHANRRNMLGPAMLRVYGQQFCARLHGP